MEPSQINDLAAQLVGLTIIGSGIIILVGSAIRALHKKIGASRREIQFNHKIIANIMGEMRQSNTQYSTDSITIKYNSYDTSMDKKLKDLRIGEWAYAFPSAMRTEPGFILWIDGNRKCRPEGWTKVHRLKDGFCVDVTEGNYANYPPSGSIDDTFFPVVELITNGDMEKVEGTVNQYHSDPDIYYIIGRPGEVFRHSEEEAHHKTN